MIPQDYSPNLMTTDVLKFVCDEQLGPGSRHIEPLPKRTAYTIAGNQRDAGSFDAVDSVDPKSGNSFKKPLTLFWSYDEHYSVMQGKHPHIKLLGDFEIIVPQEQPVKVYIFANLLIKDGTPSDLVLKISNAFSTYNAKIHGDARKYAEDQLKSDPLLTADMALILYSFELEKIGPSQDHSEIRDARLAIYEGAISGTIYPSPADPKNPGERISDDDGGYFQKNKIRAVLTSKVAVPGTPMPNRDALHEREIKAGEEANVIEEIAKREESILDCASVFTKHDYKIADLVTFPEFKGIVRDYRLVLYRDSCGNEISIVVSLPVIQTRNSTVSLWAYLRYPDNPQQVTDLMGTIIQNCAIGAALAGAVVGVAFGNLGIAIAAFKALFAECVQSHFDVVLDCMVPGLALFTTENPPGWVDFVAP